MICCVVNNGDAHKVMKFAGKYGVKDGVVSIGHGTVHSRILEFLKINDIRKEIVTMVVEEKLAADAIKGISRDMAFDKPHHGIAFSHYVSEVIGSTDKVEDTKISEVKNSMYSAIYVIVERGKAEEVIEAAKKAGARGGTIVNARGSGTHEAQKLFSIEIEPEKEKVIIIAHNDLKDGIIAAVSAELRIDEPGNGIIFVMAVDEVYGLR